MAGKNNISDGETKVVSRMLPPDVVGKRLREVCNEETGLSQLCCGYMQQVGLAPLVYLLYLVDPNIGAKEALGVFVTRYRGRYYGYGRALAAAAVDARRSQGWTQLQRSMVAPKDQETYQREATTCYDIVRAEGMCYLFRKPKQAQPTVK